MLGQPKQMRNLTKSPAILNYCNCWICKGCTRFNRCHGLPSQSCNYSHDYLLAKGNHPSKAVSRPSVALHCRERWRPVEKTAWSHRMAACVPCPYQLSTLGRQFSRWKALKSARDVAISHRIENMGKPVDEYRYYISSAELTPEQSSVSAVRGHWAIGK